MDFEQKLTCPACGAELTPGAKHCTECGANLGEAAAAAAAVKAEEAATEAEAVFSDSFVPPAPPAPPVPPAPPAPTMELYEDKPEAPKAPSAAPAAPAAAAYPPAREKAPEDPDKPHKKSRYAPMTSWGMAIELFLMSIPVIGFILMIVWSCGVCRKIARRNLARAYLILFIAALIAIIACALLARFVFPDQVTGIFEKVFPGYTIQWN